MDDHAHMRAALAMAAKTEIGTLDGVKVREALSKQNGGPFSDA